MAGYSFVPSRDEKIKKTRRTSLFPDFDRLCCSTRTEQADQPAAFTGVTAAELRAKTEASAKSAGAIVLDRGTFVETAAGGSHAPDGWHGGGSLYRPDAVAMNPGHQIGDQSYMPCDVPQQQCDPYHYHQHGPSFGQAIQPPSHVVEHPQFYDGEPSFVQPSHGQPMQHLAPFEQPQFLAPPHSHNHENATPLSIANLTSFDEQTQQGGSPKFVHQSFQKMAPPPTPIYNTQEYIYARGAGPSNSAYVYPNTTRNDDLNSNQQSSHGVNMDNIRNSNSCIHDHKNVNEYSEADYYGSGAEVEIDYRLGNGYENTSRSVKSWSHNRRSQNGNMKSSRSRNNNSSRNKNHNSLRRSYNNSSTNKSSQGYYEMDAQAENDYLDDGGYRNHEESFNRKEYASEGEMDDKAGKYGSSRRRSGRTRGKSCGRSVRKEESTNEYSQDYYVNVIDDSYRLQRVPSSRKEDANEGEMDYQAGEYVSSPRRPRRTREESCLRSVQSESRAYKNEGGVATKSPNIRSRSTGCHLNDNHDTDAMSSRRSFKHKKDSASTRSRSTGRYLNDNNDADEGSFGRSFRHQEESGGRAYPRSPPDLPDFLRRREKWTESCTPPYVPRRESAVGSMGTPSCSSSRRRSRRSPSSGSGAENPNSMTPPGIPRRAADTPDTQSSSSSRCRIRQMPSCDSGAENQISVTLPAHMTGGRGDLDVEISLPPL
eukprot:CAMPEP_0194297642 /NCGR_PEP_ID=MMETSP0169-20130528/59380_1 /TAXON_ID=218684 /ORGANISM="Corethron pennatum, Strain L29A3" /LENGTH=708 /DNA_ID=CAMNT_0039047509 /DNA_START=43 /DNA_END=2172 /DNA_ORIENTATION=+